MPTCTRCGNSLLEPAFRDDLLEISCPLCGALNFYTISPWIPAPALALSDVRVHNRRGPRPGHGGRPRKFQLSAK